MTTDNRTNEQIVYEVLGMCGMLLGTRGSAAKRAIEELEAANRLAGEPSEEQVERAAIAFTCETQSEWDASPETYKQMIREDMRSALNAASVAPQAESGDPDELYWRIKDALSDPVAGLSEVRRRRIAELLSKKLAEPAPVQPSSTVDEGVVADAISAHNTWYTRNPHTHEAWQGCTCGDRLPSGVAKNEWHAAHQARAVVEAIRGEGL